MMVYFVIDLLAVCHSIVRHFKHSTIAYHKLDQTRKRLGTKKGFSMLIPVVKILEKALAFNKNEDDSGIQTMKGEMIKSL